MADSDLWGKLTLTESVVRVAAFVSNAAAPWPAVDVAADAALLDRILAITGRAP